MSWWPVWACVALQFLCSGSLTAQEARGTVVTGIVRDDGGAALEGAIVSTVPRLHGASTDARGRFRLPLPTGGRWRLRVGRIGHADVEREVLVADGDSAQLEFVVARKPFVVERVVVKERAVRDPFAIGRPATVLSEERLSRAVGTTLAQTLAAEPGIHARTQGPAAAMPIVRGLTGDRITMLQDGMRTADLAGSAPDHGVTIDPLAARGVELLRGPAALMVGNTALGGVVNVLSSDVPDRVPARAMLSLSLQGESASEGGGTQLEATTPLGASTALRVRVGARAHDDLRLVRGTALPNTSLRNSSQAISLSRRGEVLAESRVAVRRYAFEYGLPWRDDPSTGVRLRGARHEASVRADLRPRHALSGLRLEATSQGYEHDEVNVDGSVGTALGLRTHQAQLTAVSAPGPLGEVTFGASMLSRRNDVRGAQALTPPNVSEVASMFAHRAFSSTVLGRRIAIPLALRVERSSIRSDRSERFGDARQRRFTELSAAGGIAVPVGQFGSVEATLARTVRPPTSEELFSRAGHAGTGAFEIGNPALAAERSRGAEIVARLFGRRWRGSLGVYDNRVDGWIGVYPAGRDTVIDAGGIVKTLPLMLVSPRDARIRGVEGSVDWWHPSGFSANIAGDVLHARDVVGDALPFMPAGRLGANVRWVRGAFELGTGTRRAFAQSRVPDGEYAAGGYTLMDAHASWRITRASGTHTVSIRAENVADARWRDAASRTKDFAPGSGRNILLSYRLDLFGDPRDGR